MCIRDSPLAIRYPRGQAYRGLSEFDAPVEYGKAEMLFEEKDIALFALGSMVSTGEHVREKLKARGYSCTLVNARFEMCIRDRINNGQIPDTEKQAAIQSMIRMTEISEKENAAETRCV